MNELNNNVKVNRKELKKLRKGNELSEKKMTKESEEAYTDMIVYLRTSRLSPLQQEMVRADLISMIVDGESRGETINDIFGADHKKVCDDIIENYPEMTVKDKILRGLSTTLLCLSILLPIMSISDFIIGNFEGDKSMNVRFNLSSLVLLVVLIVGANMIVTSICKNAFSNMQTKSGFDAKSFLKLWIIFFIIIALLMLIRWKLTFVLFTWNIFVAFGVSALMWLVHYLIGLKTEY